MEKDLHLVNKLRIRKLTKVIRFPVPPNASPEERRAAAERAYAASAASAMPEDNDWYRMISLSYQEVLPGLGYQVVERCGCSEKIGDEIVKPPGSRVGEKATADTV